MGRQKKYCSQECYRSACRKIENDRRRARNMPIIEIDKYCYDCKEFKDWKSFSRDKSELDGLNNICRTCASERHAEWRKSNKGKIKDNSLQRNYGITLEEYFQILDVQGGGCAICGQSLEANGKALAVDHDHRSRIVRGIACAGCNKFRIGNNTLEVLEGVVEYLRNPPAVAVLGERLVPIKKRRPKKRTPRKRKR